MRLLFLVFGIVQGAKANSQNTQSGKIMLTPKRHYFQVFRIMFYNKFSMLTHAVVKGFENPADPKIGLASYIERVKQLNPQAMIKWARIKFMGSDTVKWLEPDEEGKRIKPNQNI